MNRRNIIIISSIIVALLLGVGTYLYLSETSTTNTPSSDGISFPIGSSGVSSGIAGGFSQQSNTPKQTYVPGSGAPIPRLYELHSFPVAGAGFSETGRAPAVLVSARYIERGLGNIFETPLETLAETRISNETRPRLSEALWGNNGKSIVVRFLDPKDSGLIKTKILNISASTPSLQVGTSTQPTQSGFLKTEEIFMTDNIPFVAVAGDNSDKLFYFEDMGASIKGFVSGFKNLNASNIFSSTFSDWLPQMPNQKLVTLTTKPSALVPGHLFFINTTTKSVTKIIGDINGLTTLTSPDGNQVLYAEITSGRPQLSILDVAKNQTRGLSPQTLPEKCVWSNGKKSLLYCAVPQSLPQGTYPDQWYQGVLSFSDTLWQIDPVTQNATIIMTPSEQGASNLDMTNLLLSTNNAYLLFINKNTGTPWMYRLTENAPTIPIPKIDAATNTPSSPSSPIAPKAALPSAITPDMQKIN